MDGIIRKLHSRGPANRGISVDAEGAMLGPDCVLVRRTAQGYRCITRDEAAVPQDALSGDPSDSNWLFEQCRRIAKALDDGDVALAQILGVYLPINDPDAEGLNHLALAAPLIKANFDPGEARLPKGDSHGGEWTTGGGSEDASVAGTRDANLIDVADQGGHDDAVAAGTAADTPTYDTVDAALLEPAGPGATTDYKKKLTYSLDDAGEYAAGVTIINEDRGFSGVLARVLNGTPGTNPVNVSFLATIETANGPYTTEFAITDRLPVGGWVSIPWSNFGPLRGPGRVRIIATNHSPYYTGVIAGANRMQADRGP